MIIIQKSNKTIGTYTETFPTYHKIAVGTELILELEKNGSDNIYNTTATVVSNTNYTATLEFSLPYTLLTGEWLVSIYDGYTLEDIETMRIKDAETEYAENDVTLNLKEYERIDGIPSGWTEHTSL